MTRSADLEQFYADILICFAEGGIQMIGQVVDTKRSDNDDLWYDSVTVHYWEDFADTCKHCKVRVSCERGHQGPDGYIFVDADGDFLCKQNNPDGSERFHNADKSYVVTRDTIATAFTKIMNKRKFADLALADSYRKDYAGAYTIRDAGDIDAVAATNIVEIALFGKVVYG